MSLKDVIVQDAVNGFLIATGGGSLVFNGIEYRTSTPNLNIVRLTPRDIGEASMEIDLGTITLNSSEGVDITPSLLSEKAALLSGFVSGKVINYDDSKGAGFSLELNDLQANTSGENYACFAYRSKTGVSNRTKHGLISGFNISTFDDLTIKIYEFDRDTIEAAVTGSDTWVSATNNLEIITFPGSPAEVATVSGIKSIFTAKVSAGNISVKNDTLINNSNEYLLIVQVVKQNSNIHVAQNLIDFSF